MVPLKRRKLKPVTKAVAVKLGRGEVVNPNVAVYALARLVLGPRLGIPIHYSRVYASKDLYVVYKVRMVYGNDETRALAVVGTKQRVRRELMNFDFKIGPRGRHGFSSELLERLGSLLGVLDKLTHAALVVGQLRLDAAYSALLACNKVKRPWDKSVGDTVVPGAVRLAEVMVGFFDVKSLNEPVGEEVPDLAMVVGADDVYVTLAILYNPFISLPEPGTVKIPEAGVEGVGGEEGR